MLCNEYSFYREGFSMFFSRFFKPFFNLFSLRAFRIGYLKVSAVHKIFYRVYGNPKGKTVICFHGGPGYWSNLKTAKNFNLKKYKVILFDQRGCGKSLPLGEMNDNTTQDLVDDAAKLLDFLKIDEKVIVFGSSWGSTLALLFAETFPQRVERLILSKVFLANHDNRTWELENSALFYPDVFEKIAQPVQNAKFLPAYYASLINSEDLQKKIDAVNLYGSFENVLGSLNPKLGYPLVDETLLNSSKIMMNYAANRFFLKENQILENVSKIKHIPTLIVHNRLDFVCPLKGAFDLHKALPLSHLVIVPERGHGGPLISQCLKKEIAEIL